MGHSKGKPVFTWRWRSRKGWEAGVSKGQEETGRGWIGTRLTAETISHMHTYIETSDFTL